MSRAPANTGSRDWRTLKLAADGRSLIEASAGTGKTWTISVLYLRLLLEQGLSPRQIVVTTFTNAAAQELRERLRARLLWAWQRALQASSPAPSQQHSDEVWLAGRWRDDAACRGRDLQQLGVALAELDMAPISTLHGLCQRVLSEHPFAAGALFKGGELVSGDSLLDEIARDLQRRLNQGDATSDPLIALQHEAGVALQSGEWMQYLKLLLQPGNGVHCPSDADIRAALPAHWGAELKALSACFGVRAKLGKAWSQLADLIEDPFGAVVDADALEKDLLESSKLTGVLKAHQGDPRLAKAVAFAEQCVRSGVLHFKELRFWAQVAQWARVQAQARLAGRNQRSFDALISTVHGALAGDAGRSLADVLFTAWPVALVDEFQDTDGIQYGILDRIYRDANGGKRGRLVMIGDPKQAIYRFRGGDVQAYLRAAKQADADGRITLDTNRRSSRHYVAAVNEFYQAAGSALGACDDDDTIHFEPVLASGRRDGAPYCIDGEICSRPLVIHYQPDCPESADARREQALIACAEHIHGLLHDGRHVIGGERVKPSDIVVLLPANHQVNRLRELLRERDVPCVTTTRSSVFATDTARELQVILYAVAHCTELAPMRAALATRLWGADYAQVRDLGDDPLRWQALSRTFHRWHELWQQRGVLALVNALIEAIAVEQLDGIGGERALTDLRHLGELLQLQSDAIAGVEALLAWFSDQRESGASDSEDAAEGRQLRIESDARRVSLMTLHASKGLEFPIVFLPLMWAHSGRPGSGLYPSDSADDGLRRLECGEQAKAREQRALFDERFRVLYVALTRAIHACHVYALPPDRPAGANSKQPAQGSARSALDVMLERIPMAQAEVDLASKTPHVQWLDGWPQAPIAAAPAATEPQRVQRAARVLPAPPSGPLPARHSFTTLTHGRRQLPIDGEAAAADERSSDADIDGDAIVSATVSASATRHPQLDALAMVAGADFGNAVHGIFEHRLPRQPLAAQRELVLAQLREYNVRRKDLAPEDLLGPLTTRLQALLDTPLDGPGSPCLGALAGEQMRAEMEFFFALEGASLVCLRAACAAAGDPDLIPSGERTLAGLMNGKIDLVFAHDGKYHVLDYKSNALGDCVEHYCGDALRASMDKANYRFQALLYTVALERYLQQRIEGYLRARDLGDCWYVFIRAVGLRPGVSPPAGVWHHRFSDAVLDAAQHALSGTVVEDAA